METSEPKWDEKGEAGENSKIRNHSRICNARNREVNTV
jgi:hypothetical protein